MPYRDATASPALPGRARPGIVVGTLALLALTACDVTTGPGHFRRDLRGDYQGTFTLEWEPVGHGRGDWLDGFGSIRIRRQHRPTFSGDWSWHLDGHLLRGDLEAGREEFRDEVTFFLEPHFGHDLLEEVTDCFFVGGDRHFWGIVRHHRLRAERTARLHCHDSGFAGDWVFRLSFVGWR